MLKSTQELLHRLEDIDDIMKYLDENSGEIIEETPESYLSCLLEIKGLKVANVAQRSERGDYVYKVFQGKRKASREILLAIAIGMSMTVSETQLLLRIARTAQLDPRNQHDSVIIYALSNNLTVQKTNDILYDVDEETL